MFTPQPQFRHVHANPLPDGVKVAGITFRIGAINSPPDTQHHLGLPSDLLTAFNLACAHTHLAMQILQLVEGLEPDEYHRRVHEFKSVQIGPMTFQKLPNELESLAIEAVCQNGAEVITALSAQLTASNGSRMVRVGRLVSERNAHEAAYVTAKQLANEVLNGWPLSINSAELESLRQQIEAEAVRVAAMRKTDLLADATLHAKQRKILSLLEGKVLRLKDLAKHLDECDQSRLHRDYLKQLMECGYVKNDPRRGYFRPDAPPN